MVCGVCDPQSSHLSPGRGVPDLDELVTRPAHDARPVRRHRDRAHLRRVTRHRALRVHDEAAEPISFDARAAACAGVSDRENLQSTPSSELGYPLQRTVCPSGPSPDTPGSTRSPIQFRCVVQMHLPVQVWPSVSTCQQHDSRQHSPNHSPSQN